MTEVPVSDWDLIITIITEILTWQSVAFAVIVVYMIFMFNKIQDIKHYYTEQFMRFAKKELREIRLHSVKKFSEWLVDNHDFPLGQCVGCIHPKGSFIGSIKLSLEETLHAIKALRYQNHFHKLNSIDLEKFAKIALRELRADSQDSMVAQSVGLGAEIYNSNDYRFSEEAGVKILVRILEYSIELKKEETKEVLSLISGVSTVLKIIKGVVR